MSHIFLGDDAVRPWETAAQRLAWAYGIKHPSDLARYTVMDSIDYRGQLRGAVFDDVTEQMARELMNR